MKNLIDQQFQQARLIGMNDYKNGIIRASAQSTELNKMFIGRNVGETPEGEASSIDLMKLWYAGWDKAKELKEDEMNKAVEYKKGMLVNILVGGSHEPVAKYKNLILVGDNVPQIHEVHVDEPHLEIGHINFRGEVSTHAKLVTPELKGKWLMFCGNFCTTTDSRFKEICGQDCIKIFSRHEG
ncbi:hypothetical protein HYO65_gp218 [Tenacibaculum phage PTm1]|uniref:Uncharacterized protein n=2 Tax=Shirahamavirus PTm1 TaxID=2846435 RepID=A0A5S9ER29_9CAUD|nr:hypothetical protein HYO65_gp218 [Tenacibaculum phage PTm1]BBI90610.1 hypothetical protein [Tenacibaculum phage PTm1]BBI90916.1 hypothetical protein [Tenacibaculum phage PTm5]